MIFETPMIKFLQKVETSLTYILPDRNGVEPNDPYVIVSVENIEKASSSTKSFSSLENKQSISVDYLVTYNITLHAKANDEAHNKIEKVHLGLDSDLFTWTMYQEGLGMLRVDDIIYISQPVDTVNYRRASFDIICSLTRTEEFFAPSINQVKTDGDLDGDNNTYEIHVEKGY